MFGQNVAEGPAEVNLPAWPACGLCSRRAPLTADHPPGNMRAMNGMRASEGSLGRITLAIVLVYLLLFRALLLPFPGPATQTQAGPGPFGAWVLCSHDGGKVANAENNSGDPASHPDNCCDDCCLLRIGGLAPLILVATLIVFSRISSRAPPLRAPVRAAAGPPWRIAARPQAPRAPPQLCFV